MLITLLHISPKTSEAVRRDLPELPHHIQPLPSPSPCTVSSLSFLWVNSVLLPKGTLCLGSRYHSLSLILGHCSTITPLSPPSAFMIGPFLSSFEQATVIPPLKIKSLSWPYSLLQWPPNFSIHFYRKKPWPLLPLFYSLLDSLPLLRLSRSISDLHVAKYNDRISALIFTKQLHLT